MFNHDDINASTKQQPITLIRADREGETLHMYKKGATALALEGTGPNSVTVTYNLIPAEVKRLMAVDLAQAMYFMALEVVRTERLILADLSPLLGRTYPKSTQRYNPDTRLDRVLKNAVAATVNAISVTTGVGAGIFNVNTDTVKACRRALLDCHHDVYGVVGSFDQDTVKHLPEDLQDWNFVNNLIAENTHLNRAHGHQVTYAVATSGVSMDGVIKGIGDLGFSASLKVNSNVMETHSVKSWDVALPFFWITRVFGK